jgi:nicotinamidase/pyrazinamidase
MGHTLRPGLLWLMALMLTACGDTHVTPERASIKALIIVDMQYDFLPGGSLPTAEGDEIIGLINALQHNFDLVVATQDWHPQNHGSFASNHIGRSPGELIDLNGLEQVLWPDHAVQGSPGAELLAEIENDKIARVFQKGLNPEVDSYSGFFDNGKQGDSGLNDYLRSQGVTAVYVVGLALDYCVKYTAIDAQQLGYDTTLIVDASRAVNLHPMDGDNAVVMMRDAGITVLNAGQLEGFTLN